MHSTFLVEGLFSCADILTEFPGRLNREIKQGSGWLVVGVVNLESPVYPHVRGLIQQNYCVG